MYSFDQVILELDNAIALKTLKNWANRIEKMTDTRFERRYAKNSAGHSYSYKVFSIKDIENFQELLRLRENNVPLNEAINEVFMSDENKATHINKQEIEERYEATFKGVSIYSCGECKLKRENWCIRTRNS